MLASLPILLTTFATLQPDAEADTSPIVVAVLPADAAGLPTDRRALVLETIESRIPEGRVEIAPRSAVTQAMAGKPADCGANATCRDDVAAKVGARFVVRASVTEPKPSDYAIRVEVYEVGKTEVVASFDDACTICSEADLGRIVRERALDAREALLRAVDPPAETLAPPVDVPPPVVAPTPKGETTVVRASKLTLAGWGLIGGGIAGTVGGVVLLAMQGSKAGCPADPQGGQCIPLVYRTVIPGAVALGVGVALVGTGVGLVVVGKRRDDKRASVAIVPSGRGLALRGRF
jgi:hypothetical protein